MQIRPATLGDIAPILLIENACFDAQTWTKQMFADAMAHPLYTLMLIEVAGEIVGYICYKIMQTESEIENLAVAIHARRKGIAQQLLNFFLADVSQKGVRAIFLEVDTQNLAALTLYQKNGFIQQRLRKDYYGQGIDALECVKVL